MSETRIAVMFLKLLLYVDLLFIVATATDSCRNQEYCSDELDCHTSKTCSDELDYHLSKDCPPDFDYHLSDTVVPKHYNVTLTVPANAKVFHGKFSVLVEISATIEIITLHAYKLQVIEEWVLLFNERKTATYRLQKYNYCERKQMMVLKFQENLSPGLYVLSMNYSRVMSEDQGLIPTYYTDENRYERLSYVTVLEFTGARSVFPCWDNPTMKATFSISIVHTNEYTALSNIPLQTRSSELETVRTDFHTTPVIPTYLVTIALVDFTGVLGPYNVVQIWCRSQVKNYTTFAQKVALKTEQFFMVYFEKIHRIPKMDFVAFLRFSARAITSSRLTVCREEDIVYDENLHFSGRKVGVAISVAQEVSRQWLESLESPTQWTEVSLRKALAMYFGFYVLQQIHEDWRMMDLFVVQVLQPTLRNDIDLNMASIASEFDPFYSRLTNNKANVMMYMLQHMATRLVLRSSVREYLSIHEPQNSFNNFTSIVQKNLVQLKGENYSSYNLEQVMVGWLTQKRYPVLTIERYYDQNKITIAQESYEKNAEDDFPKWQIPITYTTESELDFHHTSPRLWLNNDTVEIEGIDSNDWIIVNIQQTGYYRVNYDAKNWLKIVQYLHTLDYKNIHAINRAQLIDNAYHFLMDDKLDYSIFIDLTRYLSKETDYIPWHSMFNVLWYTSSYFEFSESKFFKEHMLDILDKVLKKVGYIENLADENMSKALRLLATRWACRLGHTECIKQAQDRLLKHLENPKEHPISPWWKEWTYCEGLKNVNTDVWQRLMDLIVRKNDTDALKYLSCTNDHLIITEYLNYILSGNQYFEFLAADMRIKLFVSILKRYARTERTLSIILTCFKRIKLGNLSNKEKLIHIIMELYSKDHFDKIITFVKYSPRTDEETVREVERTVELRQSQLVKYQVFMKRL